VAPQSDASSEAGLGPKDGSPGAGDDPVSKAFMIQSIALLGAAPMDPGKKHRKCITCGAAGVWPTDTKRKDHVQSERHRKAVKVCRLGALVAPIAEDLENWRKVPG